MLGLVNVVPVVALSNVHSDADNSFARINSHMTEPVICWGVGGDCSCSSKCSRFFRDDKLNISRLGNVMIVRLQRCLKLIAIFSCPSISKEIISWRPYKEISDLERHEF